MKKWLKWTLLVLILLIVSIFLYLRFGAGMDLPEGRSGEEADALAMKMMSAVGDEAWDDTRFVHWTFTGRNTYTWDRTEGMVRLESGGLTVVLDTATRNGWAEKDGEALSGAELENALKDAWAYFCNDSFWLIAPLKAMDPGTEREVVETEEGKALMVSYSSGGVTPGDRYMWYLGEDGLPYAYRMWVQILPTPGVRVTWEDWTNLHTGVKIAQKHMMGPVDVAITDLKSGSSLSDIDMPEDLFQTP